MNERCNVKVSNVVFDHVKPIITDTLETVEWWRMRIHK